MDKHGNAFATEGCDRCDCGCKYWENDTCVSCGAPFTCIHGNHVWFGHECGLCE